MPARSCVCSTTRIASPSACSGGGAASQSGSGYEPTTVVRIFGAFTAPIIIHRMVNFAGIEALEEFMTRPSAELSADLARARRYPGTGRRRQDGADAGSHGE